MTDNLTILLQAGSTVPAWYGNAEYLMVNCWNRLMMPKLRIIQRRIRCLSTALTKRRLIWRRMRRKEAEKEEEEEEEEEKEEEEEGEN